MTRGTFVVFEGGDSVGKSTQVAHLVRWLSEAGYAYVETKQPGGTPLGSHIRGLVLDPVHGDVAPWAEALLYAADKAQHIYEVVEPALARGEIVVCDRYVDSTLAYQGAGRAINYDSVEQVARWATGGLRPDLTVLLDADPSVALQRISSKDRLEGAGIDFHKSVRAHFLELASADPARYLVIPAFGDELLIARLIRERISALLAQ